MRTNIRHFPFLLIAVSLSLVGSAGISASRQQFGPTKGINCVAFTPDGHTVVAAGFDDPAKLTISLLDVTSGTAQAWYPAPPTRISMASISVLIEKRSPQEVLRIRMTRTLLSRFGMWPPENLSTQCPVTPRKSKKLLSLPTAAHSHREVRTNQSNSGTPLPANCFAPSTTPSASLVRSLSVQTAVLRRRQHLSYFLGILE